MLVSKIKKEDKSMTFSDPVSTVPHICLVSVVPARLLFSNLDLLKQQKKYPIAGPEMEKNVISNHKSNLITMSQYLNFITELQNFSNHNHNSIIKRAE